MQSEVAIEAKCGQSDHKPLVLSLSKDYFLLLVSAHSAQRKEQCFDRLSTSGRWGNVILGPETTIYDPGTIPPVSASIAA